MVTFPQLGNLGRIGNQLFQIASTIGIAKSNKTQATFPPWPFDSFLENPIPHNWSRPQYIFEENSTIPSLPDSNIDYAIIGYFQSEKYFKPYENDIRKLFSLKKDREEGIKEKYKEQLNQPNCSLHIRRGDYLNQQQITHHGLIGLDYYEKAAVFFPDDILFIVFSDDLDWCRDNLKMNNLFFVERDEACVETKDETHNKTIKINDILDLFFMSYCENHIICNSSFSWWGAWLNPSTTKKIIAPKQWLVNDECVDVVPSDWTKI